jgi:hypothetical protein
MKYAWRYAGFIYKERESVLRSSGNSASFRIVNKGEYLSDV